MITNAATPASSTPTPSASPEAQVRRSLIDYAMALGMASTRRPTECSIDLLAITVPTHS